MNNVANNRGTPVEHKGISNTLGVFLDFSRFGAALVVLLIHARDMWFPGLHHKSNMPGDISHLAVVVFFVLSGFVIAFSVTINNRGAYSYAEARFSRIFSVLFPALIISGLIESYLYFYDKPLHGEFNRGYSILRYFLSLFFCNELWFSSLAPPVNSPLWSLSFECWYYILFGVVLFLRRYRYLTITIISLIIGPKILALFPVWLMGFYAFKFKKNIKESWWITVCLITILIVVFRFLPPLPTGIGYYPFFMASQFLTDWLLGLIVSLIFLFFPNRNLKSISEKTVKKIRMVADLTFAVYLLHYPCLVLFKSWYFQPTSLNFVLSILFSSIISMGIGVFLERNRYLYAILFKYLFSKYSVYFKSTDDQLSRQNIL